MLVLCKVGLPVPVRFVVLAILARAIIDFRLHLKSPLGKNHDIIQLTGGRHCMYVRHRNDVNNLPCQASERLHAIRASERMPSNRYGCVNLKKRGVSVMVIIGTVIAIKKDKFEVHFDFDGEKVWVGMDNEWQRDV
eukprot:COSAG05_NODE_2173_length_3440_cov_1.486980_1_plen_136_part_00